MRIKDRQVEDNVTEDGVAATVTHTPYMASFAEGGIFY